jgi:hypothetical protein
MPNNRFALGQGLYGAGEKYSSTTEYQTLIGEHASFHRAAGNVIDTANSGKELNAELILNFSRCLCVANLLALEQMKNFFVLRNRPLRGLLETLFPELIAGADLIIIDRPQDTQELGLPLLAFIRQFHLITT